MDAPLGKSVRTMAKFELAKHIRETARTSPELVKLSSHVKNERGPERFITIEDVLRVLMSGVMNREPEPGLKNDELKCRFDGKDLDGKQIGVEISVRDSRPSLIVITVIRYKQK